MTTVAIAGGAAWAFTRGDVQPQPTTHEATSASPTSSTTTRVEDSSDAEPPGFASAGAAGTVTVSLDGFDFQVTPSKPKLTTTSLDGVLVAPLGSHYFVINMTVTNMGDRPADLTLTADPFDVVIPVEDAAVKKCQADQAKHVADLNASHTVVPPMPDCAQGPVLHPRGFTDQGEISRHMLQLDPNVAGYVSFEYVLPDSFTSDYTISLGTTETTVIPLEAPVQG